jgi:hypothetical protein
MRIDRFGIEVENVHASNFLRSVRRVLFTGFVLSNSEREANSPNVPETFSFKKG